MESKERRNDTHVKLVFVLLGIVLVGAFWLTVRQTLQPVSLTVMPETPRQGEPIMVSYALNNPSLSDQVIEYRFYVDGKLLKKGRTTVAPLSSKTYRYDFNSPVGLGDRINFEVAASSGLGRYDKAVSLPPFPPQVASSFISFASFSTSVMSSMATTAYYESNFATGTGLNTGLVISVCLILLLIFLELAGASMEDQAAGFGSQPDGLVTLQRFRHRFSTLSWILLIIFMGIVYTKIVMILSMT